jgi:hypothetical protein
MIENLSIPNDKEFVSVTNNISDVLNKLDLDMHESDRVLSAEDILKVSEENEEAKEWKDKEMKKTLEPIMKNKLF